MENENQTQEVNEEVDVSTEENESKDSNLDQNTDKETKTYTEDDFNKKLDEMFTKKFSELKADNERKLKEEKKRAKMSAEERINDDLKQAEERAKQAEEALSLRNSADQITSSLKENGISMDTISSDLINILNSTDEDVANKNVEALVDFKNAIAEEVRKELSQGSTPRVNGGTATKTVTGEDFKKMDTAERVQFSREHPEEFKQITGGH
ncbi:capsid assembly scaffolding protein Gp46 family protein [Lactobacillus terrae]|uniref:capsid assembly scaffolding protein Gp46 family protein n=1 Tax=Lactobacillus terrae TaxID=2269374 RepID=UPI000C1B7999|nr:DUF4355 domain-containing protein [Lactobacillus terrae]